MYWSTKVCSHWFPLNLLGVLRHVKMEVPKRLLKMHKNRSIPALSIQGVFIHIWNLLLLAIWFWLLYSWKIYMSLLKNTLLSGKSLANTAYVYFIYLTPTIDDDGWNALFHILVFDKICLWIFLHLILHTFLPINNGFGVEDHEKWSCCKPFNYSRLVLWECFEPCTSLYGNRRAFSF